MGLQRAFPAVGPANVRGIEINAYAAELARVSVWIGEIQLDAAWGSFRPVRSRSTISSSGTLDGLAMAHVARQPACAGLERVCRDRVRHGSAIISGAVASRETPSFRGSRAPSFLSPNPPSLGTTLQELRYEEMHPAHRSRGYARTFQVHSGRAAAPFGGPAPIAHLMTGEPQARPGTAPPPIQPAPKGLVSRMSFGSRVSAASRAMAIASPVSIPK